MPPTAVGHATKRTSEPESGVSAAAQEEHKDRFCPPGCVRRRLEPLTQK